MQFAQTLLVPILAPAMVDSLEMDFCVEVLQTIKVELKGEYGDVYKSA